MDRAGHALDSPYDFANYMTIGMLDAMVSGANERTSKMMNSPYDFANWLTIGAADTVKGAFNPEDPFSAQHWMNSFEVAGWVSGVLGTMNKGSSSNLLDDAISTNSLAKQADNNLDIDETKYLTSIEDKVTEIEKATLPEWIKESFTDGSYRTVLTNDKVKLYRTFGGKADAGGGFATTMSAANRIQAKIDTALLPEWGNSKMYEAVIGVPEGQVLNIGKVAEQYTKTGTKLVGGADQILLPQNWPLEWIEEIKHVPSK
jgi:hypothetical protein